MTIPTYLAVAQWALLLAFGVLVVVMYRQLGWAFERLKPNAELGPAVGTAAAPFGYTRVGDGTDTDFAPAAGRPTLLAFVDPTCSACERLVASLDASDEAGELDGIRALLVTSEPTSYLQISDEFQATRLEIGRVASSDALELYRVSATPLLVGIDAAGVVRSAGPAIEVADVRAAAERLLTRPAAAVTAESNNGRNPHPMEIVVGSNEQGGDAAP